MTEGRGVNVTPEMGRKIAGSNLTPPEGKYRTGTGKHGPWKEWEELVVVDDFKVEYPDQIENGVELGIEKVQLRLRISDQVPSANTGQNIFDRGTWYWSVWDAEQARLQEAADQGDAEAQTQLSQLQQSQGSSRRMQSFLRALGYQDVLANRATYVGLNSIAELTNGAVVGKLLTVTIRQGDDKDGVPRDNVRKFVSA